MKTKGIVWNVNKKDFPKDVPLLIRVTEDGKEEITVALFKSAENSWHTTWNGGNLNKFDNYTEEWSNIKVLKWCDISTLLTLN